MTAEEFSKILYDEMEALTEADTITTLERARELYLIILKLAERLKYFINQYTFENTKEEINFFRNVKPKFFTKLFYYQKIFEIQSGLPVGMMPDITAYYLKELDSIKNYIGSNKDFLTYYRSQSGVFDEIYFVRKEPDLWLSLNTDECEQNNFTTIYDHKLSKLLAYEQVSAFIIESIDRLQPQTNNNGHTITWTAPKAALIELLYAIQTSGACNNGTVEVKHLANHFEELFNVKLGNFYRTFQEIRIRKMSRTTFLDQLKDSLVKRMDNSDENPRF